MTKKENADLAENGSKSVSQSDFITDLEVAVQRKKG